MHLKFQRIPLVFLVVLIVNLMSCSNDTQPLSKTQNRQLRQILSTGKAGDTFREPRGISFNHQNHLIVTDFRNYRVVELSLTGDFLATWGKKGNESGQFNDPTYAQFDQVGNLYVVDTWNHRIQKLTPDGQWIKNWAYGEFYAPRGIAIDDKNNVYVANTSFHNIKVYDISGRLIKTLGSEGSMIDQLKDPVGLTFDPLGNLYVADTGNQRIKVMKTSGEIVRIIDVTDWDSEKFNESYIAVDQNGKIYVTIPNKNLVTVFYANGSLFSRFGETGSGPEQMNYPTGIAIDGTGKLYVSDSLNNRIVVYTPPPPLQKEIKVEPASSIVSIVRIIVDIFALCIIFVWMIKRFKIRNHRSKKSRFANRILKRLNNVLAKHQRLQITLYIFGLIAVLSAIILFTKDHPTPGSIITIFGLTLLWFSQLPFKITQVDWISEHFNRRRNLWLILIILLFFSFFLRVYQLDEIPGGINNDAAWNGSYAMRILDGEPYTPFTPEAWGKSTIYFYLIAVSLKFLGISRLSLLLPSIILSTLAVAGFYFLSHYLLGKKIGILSTIIYAVLAWNIVFARTGYRVVLSPVCFFLTLYFFYRAVDLKAWYMKLIHYALSGAMLGIGLQSYISFRMMPLLLIFIGIREWCASERFFRKNWIGFSVLILLSALLFAPLGIYAVNNFDMFTLRSGHLFIGAQMKHAHSIDPLINNIKDNFLIFNYKARVGNFFNNDWPIMSRLMGFFFVVGFGVCARFFFSRVGFLFVLSFFFGHLPSVLSKPDAARSLLTTGSIAIFTAIAISSIAAFCFKKSRWKWLAISIIVIAVSAAELNFYFNKLANDYIAQFGYARKHTLIGNKARELADNHRVYVAQGHFIDTPKFICYGLQDDMFDITNGEVMDSLPMSLLESNFRAVAEKMRNDSSDLAFVVENSFKGKCLITLMKTQYPNGVKEDHFDKQIGNEPIFFTYIVERE